MKTELQNRNREIQLDEAIRFIDKAAQHLILSKDDVLMNYGAQMFEFANRLEKMRKI